MKCFAFISCGKILIHCKRKFKGNILVLVTITSAGWLHRRGNFWSKLEKPTLFIKAKMPKLGSVGYHTTQAVSACLDMPFCLENSATALNAYLAWA